jgi:tetratricopeptide (TPR) repeat protein
MIEDSLAFFQKVMDRADDPDPAVRLDTAVVCRRMADTQLILGRWPDAKANYLRTIQLLDGLSPELRDAAEQQDNLAGCYTSLGHLAGDTGRPDECERYHREALAIHERQAHQRPDDPGPRQGIAQCEHNLGGIQQIKRPEEIESHYRRSIDLRDEILRGRPEDEQTQAALAQTLINLALHYQGTNRPAEATEAYVRADTLLRPLVARYPEEEDYSLSLAALDHNWAYLLEAVGQAPSAFARLGEAILLSEEVLRREPLHIVARSRAVNSHGVRVHLYERRGRWADAVRDWDRIVEIEEGKVWLNRALLAVALGRAGDRVRAVAEARALKDLAEVSNEGLWTLAGVCARAAAEWRKDDQTLSTERDQRFEESATAAVVLLRKLHEKGYFKNLVNAVSLRTDADLKILRDRPDFQRLLAPGGSPPR